MLRNKLMGVAASLPLIQLGSYILDLRNFRMSLPVGAFLKHGAAIAVIGLVAACGGGGGGSSAAKNPVVSLFAGGSTTGTTDGAATVARFNGPFGVAASSGGKLYVADTSNHTIREIDIATGVVSTLAGTATTSGSADGTGVAATFNGPQGLVTDGAGNLYVADTQNHLIRKIVISTGVVTTFAGTGGAGRVDAVGTAASFSSPRTIALGSDGNLYVADTGNNSIRKIITGSATVSLLAGDTAGNFGTTDATGTAARFTQPGGIAADASGNLFVTDTDNHTVRKVVAATGVVTTLAGAAGSSGSTDATGVAAKFNKPMGIAADTSGNVFVVENQNFTVRKIAAATNAVTTVAGQAGVLGSTNGKGADARFNNPVGLAIDSSGNLYVADQANQTIRKIADATGN